MGNKGDMKDPGKKARLAVAPAKRAGYEYLLAYKVTDPIYDDAVIACQRYFGGEIRENSVIREVRERCEYIRAHRTLSDASHFPSLHDNPELALNLLVTLGHQANYLIDMLISSLKEKHKTEGGFTKRLYRERVTYRGNMGDQGNKKEKGDSGR